jgi:hypothetical protein
VFENRMLRRMFEPMREEVTGGCRNLHNKEFYDLYSSSNIWVIKLRMGWEGHIVQTGT